MPKICFFLKKRMKGICVHVLEFMLTFDKMQNTNHLVCTKFEIWGGGCGGCVGGGGAEHFENYSSFL